MVDIQPVDVRKRIPKYKAARFFGVETTSANGPELVAWINGLGGGAIYYEKLTDSDGAVIRDEQIRMMQADGSMSTMYTQNVVVRDEKNHFTIYSSQEFALTFEPEESHD